MKKLFLIVGLIFMFGTFTNAQNLAIKRANLTPVLTKSLKAAVAKDNNVPVFVPGPGFKRCGTADADAYRMANDPDYRAGRLAFEQKVQTWLAEHPNYDPKGSVITIPVVVHVIYNTATAAEKLTITQVNEQIAYTNADYAGTNPHSMDLFPSSLKANAGIQFCLATVDPSGNSTTGIDYKQTTVTSFNITGSAASCSGYPERCTSTGGAAAWDVTKYLNIWTCNAGSSLCGISEFPTSPNNVYYGTTINYSFFGHTGASSPYNLGGTYSHESGHCLNLYHTWGDDNGTCTGTDNCNDTPNSGNMNYGNIEAGTLAESSSGVSHINTSTKLETDNCTTTSPGVLFQDFMDYSDDIDYACFTPNQVSRMTATLAAADLGLTTSATTKCGAQAAPVAAFTANNTSVNVGATVTFTDQTTNIPTSWAWTIGTGTGFSYANGTSATSQNPQVTFTTAGTYTVALTATNAKGNNTCTKTTYITVTTPTAAPVAAFTANQTSVMVSSTVSFTDQSTNTPTSWAWTIGTGTGFSYANGTSATSQNPQVTFTTAGTYTVALKATNSVGNNTCTKTSYITVTVPTSGCDTLFPLSFSTGTCYDSLALYIPDAVDPADSGYITGQNAYKFSELAMLYKVPQTTLTTTVSDVYVWYALKAGTTGNTSCKIYANSAGTPGTVLGTSATIVKSAIDTTSQGINFKNKYHFATPIAVTPGTSYFFSIAIPATFTNTTNELAIWGENITCSAADTDAYFKYNTTWSSFASTSGFGVNIDMFILPVVCSTTGINEIINDKDIKLSPNPTRNEFTVDFTGYKNTNATIEVYNMIGKLVKSVSSNGLTDKMVIDLTNQESGIYIVNIKTPEGTIIKKVSLIK